MPVLLSEHDVRSLVGMDDLIDAMAGALKQYSTGGVTQPLRTVLPIDDTPSILGVMPALVAEPHALGVKLVTVCPRNHARGLESHQASIALLNPETGELLALMDGRYVTEARTAAVSAVATRALARPDAGVLALLGSGVQARGHLDALARVRRLTDVRVWSPTREHRERFARDHEAHAPVRSVRTAEEAVRGASLIALTTTAVEPVVMNGWVDAGAHICAVGACRPDQREMETALVARARLFVDSRESALAEAGDLLIPIREGHFGPDRIAGELGEVVAGRIAGRTSAAEVTIFKSLGMAVEDVVAAALIYRRARNAGRGVSF